MYFGGKMEHYDLIVIGSGPGGEKGAVQAASFGKRVALIERSPSVGGAGVNTGTIPSKTLREAALSLSGLRRRGLYGLDDDRTRDLSVRSLLYREQEVVRSLRELVKNNIARHRIDLLRGEASFEDPHTIRIARGGEGEDVRLQGGVILIATGSVPYRAPDLPFEDPRLYDSDTILNLGRIPERLAVVGAGVIGCEYTTVFSALGTRVTLVDGRDRLLPFLDGEISEGLRLQMVLLGVDVRLRDAVARLKPEPEGVRLDLRSGASVFVNGVLFAAGRRGNTGGLGLERIGLRVGERGHIPVDREYRTAIPHVFAAGDVIGFPSLAAASMEQARTAMCCAFDLPCERKEASIVPLAVYTIPETSRVGETEESCREKGIDYEVGRARYGQNARGQIIGEVDGQLKLIFRARDRVLLGVHILGESASEIIHVGLMVMRVGGTIDVFVDAVFNYPSLTDAYKYAAYDGLEALRRRCEGDESG